MKKILEKTLARIAKAIIAKYKPLIIGITGSAGKTSAKEAIFVALTRKYDVRATPKNYNNELGLPLSIIGGNAAGKNVFAWAAIVIRGLRLILFPCRYPKMLVLEMGADRHGDLAKLVAIAPPSISVITSLGSAHIGHFGSLGAIAEEKETLVRCLPPDGYAVLNSDDPRVFSMRGATQAKVLSYGFSPSAEVRISSVEYMHDPRSTAVLGLRLSVPTGAHDIEIDLPGVVGEGHARAALAGLAVAKVLRVSPSEAAEGLRSYAPPPSRMRLVPGIKKTVLIDDTYNASPDAMFEAIKVLKEFKIPEKARRIAILGDMLELGGITEKEHAAVGERLAKNGADLFIAVGEAMNHAIDAAKAAGMDENCVIHMQNAISAGRFVQERLKQGDVVLIKGSQGVRMERAVVELMAQPERAHDLVCRQGREWMG
jgi:UDP-N-acetylmuramoyl-tripeptide--D-alanyl-D-alanine ligase